MTCHDRVNNNNITSAGHDITHGQCNNGIQRDTNTSYWTYNYHTHLYKDVPFPDLRGCGKWISLTLKHDMSEYNIQGSVKT